MNRGESLFQAISLRARRANAAVLTKRAARPLLSGPVLLLCGDVH